MVEVRKSSWQAARRILSNAEGKGAHLQRVLKKILAEVEAAAGFGEILRRERIYSSTLTGSIQAMFCPIARNARLYPENRNYGMTISVRRLSRSTRPLIPHLPEKSCRRDWRSMPYGPIACRGNPIAFRRVSMTSDSVLCHGLRIGFRANREWPVDSVLPPEWRPIRSACVDFLYSFHFGGKGEFSAAFFGGEEIVRADSVSRVLSVAASHIEHTVAEHSRDFVFIHAGVISWHEQAILFPGRSRSGKSTLIRELLRCGAVYYSDEFAVVDAQGRVHPFARPLSLRLPSGTISVHPNQIGAETGSQGIPAAGVIFTEYAANGRWRPVFLPDGRVFLELMRNTIAIRSNPARCIQYVKSLMRPAIGMRSPRADAGTVAPSILRLFDEVTSEKDLNNGKLNAASGSGASCPVYGYY